MLGTIHVVRKRFLKVEIDVLNFLLVEALAYFLRPERIVFDRGEMSDPAPDSACAVTAAKFQPDVSLI